jgi:hypothetical protein
MKILTPANLNALIDSKNAEAAAATAISNFLTTHILPEIATVNAATQIDIFPSSISFYPATGADLYLFLDVADRWEVTHIGTIKNCTATVDDILIKVIFYPNLSIPGEYVSGVEVIQIPATTKDVEVYTRV